MVTHRIIILDILDGYTRLVSHSIKFSWSHVHTTMRSALETISNRREISGFSIDSLSTAYDDTIVLGPLAGYMTLVQHTITSKSINGHTTMRYARSNLKFTFAWPETLQLSETKRYRSKNDSAR